MSGAEEALLAAPSAELPAGDCGELQAATAVADSLRAENAALRRELAALADQLAGREDAAQLAAQRGHTAESPATSSSAVRPPDAPARWQWSKSIRSL